MSPGGPWAFIGTMLYPFTGVLVGWLLLRWPRNRLQTRAQRRLVRMAFILVPILTAAVNITWVPAWGGYTGPIWWRRPGRDRVRGPERS